MKRILALLLLAAPLAAQTIAPSQIKPGTDGQVMSTVGGKTAWAPGASSVSSVFGRVGNVTATSGDYNCSQVTGAICELPLLYNQTVLAGGVAQMQRPKLNLIPGTAGAVSCADNPVTNSTDCTFTGGGSSGVTWTITNMLGSRFPGVVYQNTTSNLMFIGGALQNNGSTTGAVIVAQGPTASSLTYVPWWNDNTATLDNGHAGFSAVIMPGYYYSVQRVDGVTSTVQNWTQITGSGTDGGGGGGGVTSLNATGFPVLGGAIHLACGSGLTCNQSGQTITISIATVFSINTFTGGQTVELGTSVANPTFNATYSSPATDANITNTEGTDSPHHLIYPFETATIAGTFVHTSSASTTFTLQATDGTSSPTATQVIAWKPRIFGGVGTTGATSSVTASGTTAVLSTSDVLASAGLGSETVGQTFGPFTPSGQVIYLLLTGGTHTFVDANTGLPFAFNAPTTVSFMNAQHVTVTMYLYQSSNPLFGSYTPKVAS